MTRRVLITGATGNVGSRLVRLLGGNRDLAVRAFVRDPEKAAPLRQAGAELAVGTFEDTDAVWAAVQGVDTLVLITPAGPQAVAQGRIVLGAARDAGVRKIVRQSVIKAALDGPTDNVRLHAETERDVQSSDMAYTILRPHYFMQNLLRSAPNLRTEGKIYMGMGDARLGMIDARDIADCAAQSVISDRFDGETLTLTGPESISFYDVARILTQVLGRQVTYIPVPPGEVELSMLKRGVGEWPAHSVGSYAQAYKDGWGDFVTDDVERITGRAARSFEQFAREVLLPAG
jgi:uncharacterized protein YbjT (DUF2867 family)